MGEPACGQLMQRGCQGMQRLALGAAGKKLGCTLPEAMAPAAATSNTTGSPHGMAGLTLSSTASPSRLKRSAMGRMRSGLKVPSVSM
jgi:hypothetical protein